MHPLWQQELADLRSVLLEIETQLPTEFQPPRELVMRAFANSPDDVRVVIVGQDPYPTPGHAIGLSFAVNQGVALPRSLSNMMKELRADLAEDLTTGLFTTDGNLLRWAELHADIIRRFGRFPHRNAILGRESSPEEIEFLKQPGSGF